MNRRKDTQTEGKANGQKVRQMDRRKDIWTEGKTVGQKERQTDGETYGLN